MSKEAIQVRYAMEDIRGRIYALELQLATLRLARTALERWMFDNQRRHVRVRASKVRNHRARRRPSGH